MFAPAGIMQLMAAFLLAPMLSSIINRTKAWFAGRRGPPWLQPYCELGKLLRKDVVYSRTTTAVFTVGPLVGGAATVLALVLVPCGDLPALVSFPGDFLLVVYLLGLARFATILAALDTGSSFEGMGSSREAYFGMLVEPSLVLCVATLAVTCHSLSLSEIVSRLDVDMLSSVAGPAVLLVAAALFIVFLAENARIPVDDPNTHLELTMIHEVLILDHSGPDFAWIQYTAALKMWLLGSLLVSVLMPLRTGWVVVDLLASLIGLVLLAVLVGMVESTTARLRLVRVPQFLIAASILSIVALLLVAR